MKYKFVNDTLNVETENNVDVRALLSIMSAKEKTEVAMQILENFGDEEPIHKEKRTGYYRVWVPAHTRKYKSGVIGKIPGNHKWMPNHLKNKVKKTSPTWKTRRKRYPETNGFTPEGLKSVSEVTRSRYAHDSTAPSANPPAPGMAKPIHITAEGPVQPRQGSLLE